jgi:hypothetical protein
MRLSHLEVADLKEVSFQKLTRVLLGKNVLDGPPFNTEGLFSFERYTCFFLLAD